MSEQLKDCKILIVDDTPENVDILGEVLADYKKLVALDGERALKIAFGENRPDIILLDVMMPGMSGFEVCKILKEDERTKDIPIIFITAKAEVEDETKGLELGAVDFIPKPISPPVVLARIQNHLLLKSAQEKLKYQNKQLAEHNKYITDSINYARIIQNAILKTETQLKELLPESFLIYYPKDIISGDFFWFREIDGKKIFAVIDCTGHGVPGSMMSMVGNTLLNEIVNVARYTDPGEILHQLDNNLKTEFQKDVNRQTFDGMDAAVCTYIPAQKKLLFAGSYRPVYYIQNDILVEIKGDKKSLGDSPKNISFTTHEIELTSTAEVYLFTDGFPDQNSADGKKFGVNRLKKMLTEIHSDKMESQKEFLEKAFAGHRSSEIQRDDLTFLAARIHPENDVKIISYHGPLDHEKILSLGDELSKSLKDVIAPPRIKIVFFCVNEFLQNIHNYSDEIFIVGQKEIRIGSINVRLVDDAVEIKCSNQIDDINCDRVLQKINELNNLSEAELKQLRNEKLKSEQEITSKGGGIGFIEIIRRSRSPIAVNRLKLNNEKSLIEFTLKIKGGDK